jgi:uncharacterized protein
LQVVTSPWILGEVRRGSFKPHVRRRYPLSLEEVAAFVADLQVVAEVVPGRMKLFSGSPDPKDNPVLACAVEGRADALVTDDRKHLLPLLVYRGIRICERADHAP